MEGGVRGWIRTCTAALPVAIGIGIDVMGLPYPLGIVADAVGVIPVNVKLFSLSTNNLVFHRQVDVLLVDHFPLNL